MEDVRERLIKGLKLHLKYTWEETVRVEMSRETAMSLIKEMEQETADTGNCRVFQCKKCGYGINDIFVNEEGKYPIVPRYCPNCGRKVSLEWSTGKRLSKVCKSVI